MPKPLIALKPYLDQIRQACEKCPQDDLMAAILKLAAAQPPGVREAFLIQIRTILRKDEISTLPVDESAELLAEIGSAISTRSRLERKLESKQSLTATSAELMTVPRNF
jgi:hypothetical protein